MTLRPEWLDWPETKTLVRAFGAGELRFVGGAVRDALLGKDVADVDAATPLFPEQTMALLEKAGIKALPTGIDHGTVTAVIGARRFEITTLRKDVATDGRHAEVEYTDNWKEDAARRDFTMNALYLSPEGELFDYFGGEKDAKEGRVVFIGEAKARIQEDYLRTLRFFRFFAHYGKTAPDAKALSACRALASHISELSPERIQHELLKLLLAPKSYHSVSFMQETGVFEAVFGFASNNTALRRLEEIAGAFDRPVQALPKLASFFATKEKALAFARRLKLSGEKMNSLGALFDCAQAILPSLPVAAQKRLIRRYGGEAFAEASMLAWAKGEGLIEATSPYRAMLALACEWKAPEFMISGSDLKALGFAEGKALGEQLRALEEAWENSDYTLSKEELLKTVRKT